MDNDEIAEEYCGSSASDRFGIALNQARQSERAEIVEMLEKEKKEALTSMKKDKRIPDYIYENYEVAMDTAIQEIKAML